MLRKAPAGYLQSHKDGKNTRENLGPGTKQDSWDACYMHCLNNEEGSNYFDYLPRNGMCYCHTVDDFSYYRANSGGYIGMIFDRNC